MTRPPSEGRSYTDEVNVLVSQISWHPLGRLCSANAESQFLSQVCAEACNRFLLNLSHFCFPQKVHLPFQSRTELFLDCLDSNRR